MSETATVLDPDRVNTIFMRCLFKEGEDTSKHVRADGIFRDVKFHPGRLESHKAEIVAMLDELPDDFKKSVGGGMSFLSACNDKRGNQWTGLHQRMEQLFQLGIGVGKVKCITPCEIWAALPGGMPYYAITD